MTTEETARRPLNPYLKLAIELGPLILFFAVNAKFNIFAATAVFMAAICLALAASWIMTRHLPVMTIVTAVIVIVFGTLTLVLHNDTFIKLKPTVIYSIFAVVLGGGLLFDRLFLPIVFDNVFHLTGEGWRKLTLRWTLFFVAMALLNEAVWRTQSTDLWVTFKAFGVVPLTFLFGAAQYPLLKRHEAKPEESSTDV